MLADWRDTITPIEGADVAIIRTGGAGSLELTRGGATVPVTEVAVVTLFARVKDTVATVVDLGHKSIGVAAAAESRLQRMRRREVGRLGPPRYIGITSRVHGNAVALIEAAAAEVGGVDQRRAGGIELRHK